MAKRDWCVWTKDGKVKLATFHNVSFDRVGFISGDYWEGLDLDDVFGFREYQILPSGQRPKKVKHGKA